ncbi:hypothetical protein V8G61_04650 [Gaetbulibacter sp. M240]|uniref:hypothetical protein n=1 Tax=Gaetbulibacter sp. M240 TaxID=3126511 RepID=UPI00374EBD7E
MKHFNLIFFILPLITYSQSIKGVLYDEDSPVQGAVIMNLNRNETILSDYKGEFTISASVDDSIAIGTLFHNSMVLRVKKEFYDRINVIELDKKTNKLEKVEIFQDLKNKPFNPKIYSFETGFSMKEDIKNNPYLYKPKSYYANGFNFIEIIKLIKLNKLFKKKSEKEYISFSQYDSLFNNSNLFNDNIKIPFNYKDLFLEYCEFKKLSTDLLSKPDNIILLDSIIKFSVEFKTSVMDKK